MAAIAYVDVKDGDIEGYIRCQSSEDAASLSKADSDPYTYNLLQGIDYCNKHYYYYYYDTPVLSMFKYVSLSLFSSESYMFSCVHTIFTCLLIILFNPFSPKEIFLDF